ncbi:MAG: hypothetical protein AABY10_01820 [Nanoarchaeota archaeon]
MGYSPYLGIFGWGIFFIGVVVAIVLFAIKKKFYPVMYLVSIALYIFTVGFVMDIFDMGKNGVLLMLALSACFFILAGMYFSHKFKNRKEEISKNVSSRR